MTIKRRLLLKSMLITALLMVMAFLPIWMVLTQTERAEFPLYALIISPTVIFCMLTAVFYFDIRKILARDSNG
jgi:hypothetical protein